MVRSYLKHVALIAAAATGCYCAAGLLGDGAALGMWAGISAVACLAGSTLLLTSSAERVTWKNRLAGYLVPWGWRLNRGRLWPVAVCSWAVWMALGAAAMLLRPAEDGEVPGVGLRVGLFLAWVTDSAALMYLLGVIGNTRSGSATRLLWGFVVAVAGLIGGSVALYLNGSAVAALGIAGYPPLVAGGAIGLLLFVCFSFGRNARWN